MNRKKFIKSLSIFPLVLIPTIPQIKVRYPFKDTIGWEIFGDEKINDKISKKCSYNFDNYLLESFNIQPNEYKIDFSSGRICDFDCLQDYKQSGKFSDMIFYMEFDIKLTHSGYKKFKLSALGNF